MLEQKPAPDHVIALSLDGKLTGEGIQNYRSTLEDKLATHTHIGACIDLTNLTDMTANALVEGTKADLDLFSHLNQLRRCAFISDKEWPQAVFSFMQPLMPTVEMKVFPGDQSEDALKWAADVSKAVEDAGGPAIRFLPTTKDDVFAFEINGVVSSEDMPRVIRAFEKYLDQHDKVRLLNRMTHFGGLDPSVFMQSGLVSMKLSAMEKVERYAIVGAPGWMRRIVDTINPAFPDMDMRTFAVDQEDEAWEWIGARPANEK